LFAVGLSVAIIVPFLIVAFTVNSVRDRLEGAMRQLKLVKYRTMGIESRPKKIWITSKFMTYYLWAPIFAVLSFLWRLTVALVEIAFELVKDFVVDLVQERIPKLLEKLKRKKGEGTHDPESQELNGGGDSIGNEKAVNEEVKGKSPE
jgi:hypothetical protein